MPNFKAVILVVEDNAIIRMCALDLMVVAGFEVLEASNSDEAIKVLEARPDVHLVFTDVNMPGSMDGIKLSHYIRERWPPIKLIVASGKTIIEESHLPTGARFFRKPYDEGSIIEAMIALLAQEASATLAAREEH
jgi:CheY-like chemotaxis protein